MDDGVLSAAIHPNLYSPENVFQDYCARRTGIIKALTEDVEEFYQQCDPENDDLGLHGLPDETWEMRLPSEEVPPELPEPVFGINFARDGMAKKDWLALVAVHSDAWLMSLAFYYSGRLAFDREARTRLFMMINGLSTVLEALTRNYKRQAMIPNGNGKIKPGSKPPKPPISNGNPLKCPLPTVVEENGVTEGSGNEDQALTKCAACMEGYTLDEFWICCDICEKWFHGKCVRVTAEMAEQIKQYMCPGCSYRSRRSRELASNGSV